MGPDDTVNVKYSIIEKFKLIKMKPDENYFKERLDHLKMVLAQNKKINQHILIYFSKKIFVITHDHIRNYVCGRGRGHGH